MNSAPTLHMHYVLKEDAPVLKDIHHMIHKVVCKVVMQRYAFRLQRKRELKEFV